MFVFVGNIDKALSVLVRAKKLKAEPGALLEIAENNLKARNKNLITDEDKIKHGGLYANIEIYTAQGCKVRQIITALITTALVTGVSGKIYTLWSSTTQIQNFFEISIE